MHTDRLRNTTSTTFSHYKSISVAIKYPKQKCKNPLCASKEFVPSRPNQLFCDEQCKNHFHNQVKKKRRETTFKKEEILRHNYKVLEKLWKDGRYKKSVSEDILFHEKIDPTVFTDQFFNERTKTRINWFHDFGLELISQSPKMFLIHHR